jgi:hypothetical protein
MYDFMKKRILLLVGIPLLLFSCTSKDDDDEVIEEVHNILYDTYWTSTNFVANTADEWIGGSGNNFYVLHFIDNANVEHYNTSDGVVTSYYFEGTYTLTNNKDITISYVNDAGKSSVIECELTGKNELKSKAERGSQTYVKQP